MRPAGRRQDWRELDPSQWSKSQRRKAARANKGLRTRSGEKTAKGTANPLTEAQRKQCTLKQLDDMEAAKRIELLKKAPKTKAFKKFMNRQKERIRSA